MHHRNDEEDGKFEDKERFVVWGPELDEGGDVFHELSRSGAGQVVSQKLLERTWKVLELGRHEPFRLFAERVCTSGAPRSLHERYDLIGDPVDTAHHLLDLPR